MFGKFGHLKDGSQNCLASPNPQESVNLKSIKNRIHNMTFSRYAQNSRNVTFWRLGDINFQFFLKPCPLDIIVRFTAPSHISSFIFEKCLRLMIFHNLKSTEKKVEVNKYKTSREEVWLDFHMQNLKHLSYPIPNFTFNDK